MFDNKKFSQILFWGLIGLIIMFIILLLCGLINPNPCSKVNCNLYSISLVYCFSIIVSIFILIIYRLGKIEENKRNHESKLMEIVINDFLKKVDLNSKESEEAIKRFSMFLNSIHIAKNQDITESI